jgi:hypothetical protein
MKKYLKWFNININNILFRIDKGFKQECDEITDTHIITNGKKIPLNTTSLFYKDVVVCYRTNPIEKNIIYIKNKIIYNGYPEWTMDKKHNKVLNEWNYEDGVALVKRGGIRSQRVNDLIQLGTKCVRCPREGVKFLMTIDKPGSLHFDLYDEYNNLMNIDHIHPKSKGGKNTVENYQLMCEECNSKKGATLEKAIIFNFDEFLKKND